MLSYWEKQHFIKYDYLVVGGGLVGLSTALSLREKHPEATILILERGLLPSGASTKNAGFACFGSPSELLADVQAMGEEAAFELVKQRWDGLQLLRTRLSDHMMDYRNQGGYELLSPDNMELLDRMDGINELLLPLFEQPVFSERSHLIGEFGFNRARVAALIYNPFEAQIDTGAMMKNLQSLVRAQNIGMLTGAEVTGFEDTANEVRVRLSSNHQKTLYLNARRLAICTNAFSKDIIPDIDLGPGRGMVLVTAPLKELKFKGVFHYHQGYFYFRNVDDRILFGGGRNLDLERESTREFGINEDILEYLKNELNDLIIPGTEFEIDDCWSGIMAFGADKRPLVGMQSPNVGYALRLGGMGVALGSLLGNQLSELLYLKG